MLICINTWFSTEKSMYNNDSTVVIHITLNCLCKIYHIRWSNGFTKNTKIIQIDIMSIIYELVHMNTILTKLSWRYWKIILIVIYFMAFICFICAVHVEMWYNVYILGIHWYFWMKMWGKLCSTVIDGSNKHGVIEGPTIKD